MAALVISLIVAALLVAGLAYWKRAALASRFHEWKRHLPSSLGGGSSQAVEMDQMASSTTAYVGVNADMASKGTTKNAARVGLV